jgi:predicted permease
MGTLIQDLRFGLRMLAKNPGFTAVAVITLALGIGANTAIFSVVNAVVLKPLPYPHSDRLVWIGEFLPALKSNMTGGGDYFDWKEQNKTLAQITAYDESRSFNLTGRGTPARIHGAAVTSSFFSTLGVEPQLGRGFTAKEDQPNGRKVAVLMHAFWQQYCGSDPHVLGRTVTLDAVPYAVVGVMPASFRFPGDSQPQLLLPFGLDEVSERLRIRQHLVRIIGRLKPGVPVARAFADLDGIRKRARFPSLAAPGRDGGPAFGQPQPAPASGSGSVMQMFGTRGHPPTGRVHAVPGSPISPPQRAGISAQTFQSPQRVLPSHGGKTSPGGQAQHPSTFEGPPGWEIKVVPLAEHLAGNLRPVMLTMFGVVGLVLLIACANVAHLTLARASTRGREMAVRAVLGAGRWRLVRQLLSESIVLALGGGVAGLLIAAWGVEAVTHLIPSSVGAGILNLARPHVDVTVLLFALGVSVLTGILFGLAPAVAAAGPGLAERLKDGPQALSHSRSGGWLRGALAVAELSLALVLLIGAGLLIKSFYRALTVDLGFAPERVLVMKISLTDARYPKPEQKLEFFSDVLRRVESLPGVRAAALGDSLPLSPYRMRLMIRREMVTRPGKTPGSNTVPMVRLTVSPGYFYTLGIPLLKGRTFTDHDDEQAPKVAVLNDALARRLWPGEDPVGRRLPLFTDNLKIVGVVENVRHNGPGEGVESEIYVPYLQVPENSMQLALRAAVSPASLISAVRGQISALDPEQPVSNVTTLEQTLSESFAPRRFNTLLLAIFGAIALALAAVGIYGVLAFSVTQRTHEIGIRMALGAQRSDVLKLVVGQGFRLTLMGVVTGIAGALALTRLLSSLLYAVKPTDPPTFIAVSLVLTAVALLACYIPARRAAKVDPVVALRQE